MGSSPGGHRGSDATEVAERAQLSGIKSIILPQYNYSFFFSFELFKR